MGKKRGLDAVSGAENEVDLPSKFMKTTHGRMNEKRLIVILDGAQLEIVKVFVRTGLRLKDDSYILFITDQEFVRTAKLR